MKKLLLAAAIAASFALTAGAANAVVLPAVTTACASTDIVPNAEDCRGFFHGQFLSGSPGDVAIAKEALSQLGFVWDGSTIVESLSGLGGADPTFLAALNGTTFIGLHFGGGAGSPKPGQDSTAWYRFDAGNSDLHTIELAYNSSSDAIIYGTGPGGGVPEPATWAMMLVGFGGMGSLLRRQRRQAVALA